MIGENSKATLGLVGQLLGVVASVTVATVGCGLDIGEAPREMRASGARADELLGATTYAADCKPEWKPFIEKVSRLGRVVATSNAFAKCLTNAVKTGVPGIGPLGKCKANVFDDRPLDEQISLALAFARNTTDVAMTCTGGAAYYGSATLGTYGHSTAEEFRWGKFLEEQAVRVMTAPRCVSTTPRTPADCITSQEAQMVLADGAATVWHEAMHTHGYSHGGNDQSSAVVACGQPYEVKVRAKTISLGGFGGSISVPEYYNESTTGWHFQRNTMPYMLDQCVMEVVRRSIARCGEIETCGAGLKLVTDFDGAACACVPDPHQPSVAWRKIGAAQTRVSTDPWPRVASKIAACQDGRLYMLTTEYGLYMNRAGGAESGWTGGALEWSARRARSITCANNQLYRFDYDRALYRNDGSDAAPRWTFVGRPSATRQIAGATGLALFMSFGVLYALNDDKTLWKSETGADGSWQRVGWPYGADRIAAGGGLFEARLFALNTDKHLYLNSGDGCDSYWHWFGYVGDTVEIAAQNATTIYALNRDNTLWEGTISGSSYLTSMAFGRPRHCDGTRLVEW